jgi:hypothetical protein
MSLRAHGISVPGTQSVLTFQSLAVSLRTARFNIQQFYLLPTQCIYVFCVDLRANRDYFPIQHQLSGLYNRDLIL